MQDVRPSRSSRNLVLARSWLLNLVEPQEFKIPDTEAPRRRGKALKSKDFLCVSVTLCQSLPLNLPHHEAGIARRIEGQAADVPDTGGCEHFGNLALGIGLAR
jgi:hypothetical protein